MLRIKDITFNEQMILNGGKFILVELIPTYEGNQESNKRQGTKAIVALTGHQLEKIVVLIDDVIACSPFNALELAEVSFSGFEGEFSLQESGDYQFNAKASQLYLEKDLV